MKHEEKHKRLLDHNLVLAKQNNFHYENFVKKFMKLFFDEQLIAVTLDENFNFDRLASRLQSELTDFELEELLPKFRKMVEYDLESKSDFN